MPQPLIIVPQTLVGRAAEYVRMSTDLQQHSIAYQQAAIRLYAAQRNLIVVRTYADEAKSGLFLEGRPALIRLLADVETRAADFEAILVYDVSRWGRFQDVDESAHYEFLCRRSGIRVEYCAEPFVNDGGVVAAVFKSIKRAMAAEFSREKSVRVRRAELQMLFEVRLPLGAARRVNLVPEACDLPEAILLVVVVLRDRVWLDNIVLQQ